MKLGISIVIIMNYRKRMEKNSQIWTNDEN